MLIKCFLDDIMEGSIPDNGHFFTAENMMLYVGLLSEMNLTKSTAFQFRLFNFEHNK